MYIAPKSTNESKIALLPRSPMRTMGERVQQNSDSIVSWHFLCSS